MGQTFTSYALLGSGRVALHLKRYLRLLQLPCETWSRAENSREDLMWMIDRSSHVLFAVSDPAVEPLSRPFLNSGKTLVHFAGALNVGGVHAAHPLMTFGREARDLGWYKAIPFVVDRGDKLTDLLPGLPNPSHEIDPDTRPLYHALCALAGNSTFLLWRAIGDAFEARLSLPRDSISLFLQQTVLNAMNGSTGDLTGPVARGDWAAVDVNLRSLNEFPELRQAYINFLDLARRMGHRVPETTP